VATQIEERKIMAIRSLINVFPVRYASFLFIITYLLLPGTTTAQNKTETSVLIRNTTLIDGTGNEPKVGVDILLQGNKIVSISGALDARPGLFAYNAFTKDPTATVIVDGTGKYVIPGLIDAHVHLNFPIVFQLTPEEKEIVVSHNPTAFLYNGVTTVLNVSSNAEWIFALRNKQRSGYVTGPRIYALGHSFTVADGWGSRHGGTLDDPESARKQVLDYVAAGTDGLKIIIEDGLGEGSGKYNEMSDDILNAISDEASKNNIPTYIHAIGLPEYHRSANANPRAILHGLEDVMPAGDTLVATLLANGVAIVPTLSLFRSFLKADPHAGAGLDDPILEGTVPAFLLENMRKAEYMKVEKERFTKVARMDAYGWARNRNPIFCDNIRIMHKAGVKIAVGTDAGGTVGYNFQGYNTPFEVKIFTECGMTPMEALVAATKNGAEVIGVGDELGTIEPGKVADLLILSSNPLDNIENIRQIEWIVQSGVIHSRDEFAYKN
jgi:imidazolonepropionase-like amidohydrolase